MSDAATAGGFDRFAETFFNGHVMAQYLPGVLGALWLTIWLSVLIVIAGLFIGAGLACLRTLRRQWLTVPIIVFADLGRTLPPLVIILILYFGLPGVGVVLPGALVLFVVLALTLAAFAEEILWAGFTALPRGQWEAGAATGLSHAQVLWSVALPQALRLGLPSLVNRTLAITKMTALGSVIGVPEVLSVSSSALSFSGSATPLTMAALAYLAIFLPVVAVSRLLERRYGWKV